MALFNRSKQSQQSVLPDEVSQYYQSQQRERTGLAIVLGLVSLVVTLAVGVGLFLGGRYVYRNYVKDDATNKTAETTQSTTNTPETGVSKNGSSQTGNDTPTPDVTTPAPTQQPQTQPSTAPSSTPQTTPKLGDETTLPRTGDEGH